MFLKNQPSMSENHSLTSTQIHQKITLAQKKLTN